MRTYRQFSDSVVVAYLIEDYPGYHGTRHAFDKFDPEKSSPWKDRSGKMMWATTSPQHAHNYAGSLNKYETEPKTGPNIRPVVVQLHKPVQLVGKINNGGDKYTTGRELLRRTGLTKHADEYDRMHDFMDNKVETHHIVDSNWFKTIAKRAGHDGVVVREGKHVTYGAFHPSSIKSVFER